MWTDFTGSFQDFCRLGKNEPGVLIEVLVDNKKRQYLIGDISMYGSMMNGDCLVLSDYPVLRYKRIWTKPITVSLESLLR